VLYNLILLRFILDTISIYIKQNNNVHVERRTLIITLTDNVKEPSTQLEECHINRVNRVHYEVHLV